MIAIQHIKTLLDSIEELRKQLNVLINRKQVLTDSEIIAVSRKLDSLLNEYNRYIGIKGNSEPETILL